MRKRGYGKRSLELVHRDLFDMFPLRAWFELSDKLPSMPDLYILFRQIY